MTVPDPDPDPERLRAPLLRYCQSLLRNHHDAEEVVQDVLLQVANGHGPAPGGTLEVWLFRCARNRCFDRRRKHTPRAVGTADTAAPAPAPAFDLHDAIAGLPAAERDALLLTAIDGLGYREVAAILGCSLGTVAALRGAAVQKLRTRLEP